MSQTEFKTQIDEFLRFLDWMDNAAYEIVHDDDYGEDEGEHWRATIHAKTGYGSRDIEVIPHPDQEHELAIDLGEDNHFDLTNEWFWSQMWHLAEQEIGDLRRALDSHDEADARIAELEADNQRMQSELRSANYRLGQWNTMRNNYREEIRSLLRQRDRWKRRGQRDPFRGCCTRAFDKWLELHPDAKVRPDGAVMLVDIMRKQEARAAELDQALREAIQSARVFHGEPGWEAYCASPEMKRWRALLDSPQGEERIA